MLVDECNYFEPTLWPCNAWFRPFSRYLVSGQPVSSCHQESHVNEITMSGSGTADNFRRCVHKRDLLTILLLSLSETQKDIR